jgi:hypothetical protein
MVLHGGNTISMDGEIRKRKKGEIKRGGVANSDGGLPPLAFFLSQLAEKQRTQRVMN